MCSSDLDPARPSPSPPCPSVRPLSPLLTLLYCYTPCLVHRHTQLFQSGRWRKSGPDMKGPPVRGPPHLLPALAGPAAPAAEMRTLAQCQVCDGRDSRGERSPLLPLDQETVSDLPLVRATSPFQLLRPVILALLLHKATCPQHTVRPDKPQHRSLEWREVYCMVMHGWHKL